MNTIRTDRTSFGFGIEAEFPLVALDGRPLWYEDVSFEQLYEVFEGLSLDHLSSTAGYKLESPHRAALPFVVEGYHLPHPLRNPETILPKGVEIRTPIAENINDCVRDLELLFSRLQAGLRKIGVAATFLSHHPEGNGFRGPQNKRRVDYWQWAMEAMHTYGPDMNVSLPREIEVDTEDLHAKVNAYGPALTALSLNSPLFCGELWQHQGRRGKAARTHRRSPIAPAIELHPDQGGRLEYKTFEMSPYLDDYSGFFLLWLTLLLSPELRLRASDTERVAGLQQVAVDGLSLPHTQRLVGEVLAQAHRTLPKWGFDPTGLASLEIVADTRVTPADEFIDEYMALGSYQPLLLDRTTWKQRRRNPSHGLASAG